MRVLLIAVLAIIAASFFMPANAAGIGDRAIVAYACKDPAVMQAIFEASKIKRPDVLIRAGLQERICSYTMIPTSSGPRPIILEISDLYASGADWEEDEMHLVKIMIGEQTAYAVIWETDIVKRAPRA